MRFRFCKTRKTKTLTSSLPKFLSHENCILGGRGGGILPEKFGGDVWPSSKISYPIYD